MRDQSASTYCIPHSLPTQPWPECRLTWDEGGRASWTPGTCTWLARRSEDVVLPAPPPPACVRQERSCTLSSGAVWGTKGDRWKLINPCPTIWFIFLINKPPMRSYALTHCHLKAFYWLKTVQDTLFSYLFCLSCQFLLRFRCFRTVLWCVSQLKS